MRSRGWISPLVVALLVAGVFAVFSQTYSFEFVNLDDDEYVTANPFVNGGINSENVRWAFTAFHSGHWHPLTWLSLALDCEIWGMTPGPMHLENVAWHAANAALLFLLLGSMTGQIGRSAFVAAVFALHPLRVESVAWVTERKDVLSVFFWLLTTYFYVGYSRRPGAARYLLVLATFVVGLLAKPMLVTLPLTLLLLDFWPLRRIDSARTRSVAVGAGPISPQRSVTTLILEKVPLLLIALAAGTMTSAAQRAAGALVSFDALPLTQRIVNAAWSYVAYLGMTLWPTRLAPFYPLTDVPWRRGLVALVLLVAATALALKAWRRAPYLTVGWLWYGITLLPVIGLVQVGGQLMADRFTYVPHIGLLFGLTWGAAELAQRFHVRPEVRAAGAALVVVPLALSTAQQTTHWRNTETLFVHTLAVTTGNFMAHNNLGIALAERGRADEAMQHYAAAVDINPTWPEARNNLGNALASRRDYVGAEAQYRTALQIRPNFPSARYNLGLALAYQGRLEEAITEYRRALAAQPNNPTTHYSLGDSLERLGHLESATEHFQAAVQIAPGHDAARRRLARLLGQLGRLEEAIAHDTELLRRMPSDAETCHHLANLLVRMGKAAEAIPWYRRAIAERPDWADAYQHLATALAANGDLDAAIAEYRTALRLEPESRLTMYNLGQALARAGRAGEAAAMLVAADSSQPSH